MKVYEEGHWTINGVWVCLKKWSPDKPLAEIDLDMINVWVQIHGLTLEMLNESAGRVLGGKIGKVLMVEANRFFGKEWRSYLRIRVELCVKSL